MPEKHPNTERIGGPGAAHEDRQHPDKPENRGEHPRASKGPRQSDVSGGGGEQDKHHSHDPARKGGM